jgi:endonuclease/exonuclease/phosphatase family metal-dependent hydrolase
MQRVILIVLLLLAPGARADGLKIATWNLNWLTARATGDPVLPADVHTRSADDIARLRRYAEILAADVVALQEVDGPEIVARLFPPQRYRIHITQDSVTQRVALAIRTGIAFSANPDLASLGIRSAAGGQLRSGADVTLDLGAGRRLRLLAVHLKTGCWGDPLPSTKPSCTTLGQQLGPLEAWIAARRDEGVPFLVLGDFNRRMDGADTFWAGLAHIAPLVRATAGASSPCWGGESFIDHIIAGGPARAWLAPGTLRVLVYRETGEDWKDRLSDHCPVSVRLQPPD